MFLLYMNPILIAAAVIPAIVLLRFVYREDRLDRESPGMLLSLVLFGILATFGGLCCEMEGCTIAQGPFQSEVSSRSVERRH
mgnify:CR=1 FL=1